MLGLSTADNGEGDLYSWTDEHILPIVVNHVDHMDTPSGQQEIS